jgi:F-type H+-transporting ATPase subunit b
MEFDLTTFILEIINFLVLLWILQRLIYRPLLAALDARQQKVQAQIEAAGQLRSEAESLKAELQTRLTNWELEREQQRSLLESELAEIRSKAQAQLQQSLTDEAAKLEARNHALLASQQALLVREAADSAYGEVALMLQRLASPELTHRIVETFVEDLTSLAEADRNALTKAAESLLAASTVEIVSAHPLSASDQATLAAALTSAAGKTLSPLIREDNSLLAGLRIVIGECQLHANLADELAFFKQQCHD